MIVLMKGLDEERSVHRCMSDFHDEPWVEKIIVIDGGSTDYTRVELKQFEKIRCFIHPWLDEYHDQEIVQSNIALSYIPHGQICFILDFDERCSDQLKTLLGNIDEKGMPNNADICHISRKTIDGIRYEDSPFAVIGEDGWPIESHQIGQYPDFQCRIIRRIPEMRWMNSPHHQLAGHRSSVNVYADLIHYEKDDFRDRDRIERKWARNQARRKELGLTSDVFEARVKPKVHKYSDPELWR